MQQLTPEPTYDVLRAKTLLTFFKSTELVAREQLEQVATKRSSQPRTIYCFHFESSLISRDASGYF
jgi:hypothetical protein